MDINEKLIKKAETKELTIFDVMRSFLFTMKYKHNFFNEISPNYMKEYSKWYYLSNFPKAYMIFMRLSFNDWNRWIQEIKRS